MAAEEATWKVCWITYFSNPSWHFVLRSERKLVISGNPKDQKQICGNNFC